MLGLVVVELLTRADDDDGNAVERLFGIAKVCKGDISALLVSIHYQLGTKNVKIPEIGCGHATPRVSHGLGGEVAAIS